MLEFNTLLYTAAVVAIAVLLLSIYFSEVHNGNGRTAMLAALGLLFIALTVLVALGYVVFIA